VRIYGICLTFLIVFSSLSASAGTTFKPTTTLAAETANNTSAAQSFLKQTNGNIAGANISKAPMRSLLYPGSTAKIYAHFVPWFGFGDHMNVGYVSSDTLQVQKQVNDMVSRGLDGAVIDWYGRGESSKHFLYYDQASQAFMHQAELNPGFNFAIMHDAGALKTCAATVGCDVTQTLIDDLNYVNLTYAGSPAYVRSAGRPVIYFFGHEAYTIDWTRVRAGVAGNPMFIFRNGSGFTKPQSGGAFSWVEPTTISATNPMAINYLDGYYKTALTFPSAYSTGSAYKGFNDTLAVWGTNRILDQQCGQTWLKTIAEAGKYYTAAKQMREAKMLAPETDTDALAKKAFQHLDGVTDEWIKSVKVEKVPGGQVDPNEDIRLYADLLQKNTEDSCCRRKMFDQPDQEAPNLADPDAACLDKTMMASYK